MFVREEKIDILRVTEGEFDLNKGECSESTETAETIYGNIQPASGNTLLRLPEGRRSFAKYSMWTEEPLELSTIVMYKSARFEVELADDWNQPSSTIPHYKYILYSEGNKAHSIVEGGNSAK
jgi:hypothetical protein